MGEIITSYDLYMDMLKEEGRMIDSDQYGIKEVKDIYKINFVKDEKSNDIFFGIEYEEFDPITIPFIRGIVRVDQMYHIKEIKNCFYRVWCLESNGSSSDEITDEIQLEKIKESIQGELKKERVRILLGISK